MLSYLITLIVVIAVIGFVAATLLVGRKGRVEAPGLPPEDVPKEAPAEPVAEVVPEPISPAVPDAQAPPSVAAEPVASPEPTPTAPAVSRLVQGLSKTRSALGRHLTLLKGRDRLDDDDWDDIEAALIGADVGIGPSTEIIEALKAAKLTPSSLPGALKEELSQALAGGDRAFKRKESGPSIWLVTGVNGVGKTTSIAKLAFWLRSQGTTVVLAAADTFRAAAIDQLGTWADRVGVHMVRHAPGADPGAVVFDAIEHAKAKGIDVVIVDTAGRLHTKSNLMEELKKVRRIADQQGNGIDEILLVLDATVGQNGIAQARSFQEAVEVTGLILAKLDGSAKGGIAVAVQQELGIPVKAVGLGEGLEDLAPFDPEQFVDGLVDAV